MYESLATQGREKVHTGLAGIDSSRLKKLRNSQLKECFNLIDEMRHKLEFVARIRGISFIDDAASRSPLSTWYALETIEGKVVWIANGTTNNIQKAAEFKRLRNLVENKVTKIICFVFAGFFAVNTIMNLISPSKKEKYVNHLYNPQNIKAILIPKYGYYNYRLWTDYFMRNNINAEE